MKHTIAPRENDGNEGNVDGELSYSMLSRSTSRFPHSFLPHFHISYPKNKLKVPDVLSWELIFVLRF